MLSVSIFEPNGTLLKRIPARRRRHRRRVRQARPRSGLHYRVFETQAAASWNAWEILAQGVEARGSLDQQAICDSLHENGADTTFSGPLEFDPEVNNFWPSHRASSRSRTATG